MYLSHLKTLVLKKTKGVIPMSGAPRVLSMNDADLEARSVLAPAGNKAGLLVPVRKAVSKHLGKAESAPEVVKKEAQLAHHFVNDSSPLLAASPAFPSILQRREQILRSNLSLSASCSSDASSDSVQSRASTGRIGWSNPARHKKKQCAPKTENVFQDSISVSSQESVQTTRKKCAWVTPNTDPVYAAFHDEEWGVPVHDDKKLFELLVLSGALAELPWPAILRKRHIFREIFLDFDHASVAKLNEKKLVTPGSTARVLLSEPKLRGVVENARQISKILEEFGSFDKYCWSFVNHKPIISKFRYPRQVPVKTPKADVISKDLVKRGFRCVGPTVIYSFMQAVGITNDHLFTCDRFDECVAAASRFKDDACKAKADKEKPVEDTGKKDVDDTSIIGLDREMDELGFL